jgi:hypothetical protein
VGSCKCRSTSWIASGSGAHSRQRRSQEADYFLLHEIARQGIHVSETLSVAVRSLDAMQHHHVRFREYNDLIRSEKGRENWDRVGTRFEFQLRFLQSLLQRSEANDARTQNEITLVSAVQDRRYAVASRTYEDRLSMRQHREIVELSCR